MRQELHNQRAVFERWMLEWGAKHEAALEAERLRHEAQLERVRAENSVQLLELERRIRAANDSFRGAYM